MCLRWSTATEEDLYKCLTNERLGQSLATAAFSAEVRAAHRWQTVLFFTLQGALYRNCLRAPTAFTSIIRKLRRLLLRFEFV